MRKLKRIELLFVGGEAVVIVGLGECFSLWLFFVEIGLLLFELHFVLCLLFLLLIDLKQLVEIGLVGSYVGPVKGSLVVVVLLVDHIHNAAVFELKIGFLHRLEIPQSAFVVLLHLA